MSTVIKEYLQDGTIAANRTASGVQGIDPRRRRFALNPNIYMAMLEPRESGRQEILLPTGLVAFRTVPMVEDDYENALKNGRNRSARAASAIKEHTAREFLGNALIRYGEQGMRELTTLTLLDDPEAPQLNDKGKMTKEESQRVEEAFRRSAQGYFNALWPTFAEVGHECPVGLQECTTCRLWLIGDPALDEVMEPRLIERVEKLEDGDIVRNLRNEVVESLKARREWLNHKWAELVGELGDRKNGAPAIAKLGAAEHHVRLNLHEIEPSESATAASFGEQVAAGQAQGFKQLAEAFKEGKQPASDNTERISRMEDAIASLAESVKTLVEKK